MEEGELADHKSEPSRNGERKDGSPLAHKKEARRSKSRERSPDNRRRQRYDSDEEDSRRRKRNRSRSRTPERRSRYDRERERGNGRRDYRENEDQDRYSKDRRSDRDRDARERNSDRREERSTKENEQQPAASLKPQPVGKTGGVYIPPFRLAQMQKEINDKSSLEYQKMTWEALKKSINGLINKVSVSNISHLVPELFYENLIRGRGLLARSMMKAQAASPNFTAVYAALLAVVNTKMPEVGELVIKRLIIQFRKAYSRNNKAICLASTQFLAHLVNQQVLGVIIPLQICALLLEKPSDDSVEVAVSFITECGAILQDLSPQGFNGIFDRLRAILHEGEIDKRVQYTIEMLFATRKTNFAEHPAVRTELDLVDLEDQITHEDISLDDQLDAEERLNFFHFDDKFTENEEKYNIIKKEILGEETIEQLEGRGTEEQEEGEEESEEEEEEDGAENQAAVATGSSGGTTVIKDDTETDLINLRRTIYLTIMSSIDFNECAHKLMKVKLKPGQEMELCNMIIECCCQERTYMRFYGLLGQRFCMMDKIYQEGFDQCFVGQYTTIHRLETFKLRNVAKFFAHLLHSDAMPWSTLAYIHLNEEETTSSSRIFIKIVFHELAEFLGLSKLNLRLKEPSLQPHFEGLFPKNNPKDTRFAINFFTSIGLGGLTDDLREHLRNAPKRAMEQSIQEESSSDSDSDSDSSDSSSSDSDSDSSSSDSDSSSSDEDNKRSAQKRRR